MEPLVKKFNKLTDKQKTLIALGIFAVLVLLFYGNTLGNGFVLDDTVQIEKNAQVHSLKTLPAVFTGCQAAGITGSCRGRTFNYRPIFFASTIISWQIGGGAWSFHLVNLLYFFGAVALFFYFVKLLTKDWTLAFLSASILLIHPINSEVVNWASAQVELLLALFVLASLVFFVKYRQTKKQKYLAFVYSFYFLGLLTKEPAVFVPIVALLLDLTIFKIPIKKLLQLKELRTYLLFGVPVVLYTIMRLLVLGFTTSGGFVQFTLPERVYADVTLFAEYIWKLFYPLPLSAFHYFETSSHFLSFEFIGSTLLGVAFFALAAYLFKTKQYFSTIFFVWFVLFISPVLIFVDSVGENVFSERYLFLPSMAFSILVASFVLWLVRRYGRLLPDQLLKFGGAFLIFLFLAVTWWVAFERNQDWKDAEILYTKTISQNPYAYNIRRDLAFTYLERRKLTLARSEFEELIERAPDWRDITMAYKGLGDIYRFNNEPEVALEYYIKGTETGRSTRDFVTYNNVGVLYLEREDNLLALTYFCQAQQLFQTQQAQDNFSAALAALEEELIEPGTLHDEVLASFVPSPIQRIQYIDNRCDDEACQHAFGYQADAPEVLPPFLITSQTARGSNVEITNQAFDPNQSIIILETDAAYEDTELTFLFPTCRREYYEAVTN